MNGRWFDERQLVAHLADGSEKFSKSNEKKVNLGDENENDGAGDGEGERLDKFGKWLEEERSEKETRPEQ
jgi:HIV Tat-specific factor 1